MISHFPKTKEDALKIVQNIESRNRRYSVGLMQITSTNFSQYGVNADKLFSPCTNLAVFEKVLLDCYTRGGNLKNALSCYYSGNFSTGKKLNRGLVIPAITNVLAITNRLIKKIGRFHPSEKILKRITLLKRFLIV